MKTGARTAWGFSVGANRNVHGGVFKEIVGPNGLLGKTIDRDVYERASRKAAQSLQRSAAAAKAE